MTEYSWFQMRTQINALFNGEQLGAGLEADIVELFRLAPHTVLRTAEDISESVKAGRIRSGWAVLHSRLATAKAASDVVVDDRSERDKAVRQADRWVRHVGVHFDRAAEVLAALFGELGFDSRGTTLHPWRADQILRARMVEAWENVRPLGEQVEQDELERAERWKTNRELVR